MNTAKETSPGYQINEYMLALSPHEELRNRIIQLKKGFFDAYGSSSAVWGKPYIPLVIFRQYAMLEERLLGKLKTAAKACPCFKIELKDFGSLPTHTLFIRVTSREPIKKLISAIRGFQQLMKTDNENKPYFAEEPHIVVARKLSPWVYEKAWPEYLHKTFTGRFMADRMLLLKRNMRDKNYELAKELEFQNLVINASQGNLFS